MVMTDRVAGGGGGGTLVVVDVIVVGWITEVILIGGLYKW